MLSRLDAATCDELLGTQNSAALLRTLEEQNLFIVRLNDEGAAPSYRYHNLFQEFLRYRLRETDVPRWRNLNRRAAELFAAREGSIEQAIVHFIAAEMDDEAARAIEKIAQSTYDEGKWVSLAGWIDALAPDKLNAHPSLIVTRGMLFAKPETMKRPNAHTPKHWNSTKISMTSWRRLG